jgi:hypothetical protein
MIAHVAGLPVEELLLPVLASGAGTGLLLARAWVAARVPGRARRSSPAGGQGAEQNLD